MNNNREWELYRANRCPKCGYTSDTPFEICRNCGVVVEKFLLREERIKRGATRPPEEVREEPAGICRTVLYIITRSWLWPVPLILIQTWILFTSEAIWTTKVAFFSRFGTIHEAIAGEHSVFGLVFVVLSYWFTYTRIYSTIMEASEALTSEATAHYTNIFVTILLRVLAFSLLCWNTYVMMVNFGPS